MAVLVDCLYYSILYSCSPFPLQSALEEEGEEGEEGKEAKPTPPDCDEDVPEKPSDLPDPEKEANPPPAEAKRSAHFI